MTPPLHTTAAPALVVRGTVEHGDERGRTLGFPTANLSLNGVDVRDGVWAATVTVEPRSRPDRLAGTYVAAVSIGHRPTYYGREGVRLLEAHLLDVDGDLYDREVVVTLHAHLRPQRRFAGSGDLVRQLRDDVEATRTWAAHGVPAPRAGADTQGAIS